MNDEISAFVDGELDTDAAARFMQRLKTDDDLFRAWREYHLIGDALRGDARPGIAASFSQRLAAEPTVLAPRHVEAANHPRWMTVLSAAAGVAVVAVAAWVALPQMGTEVPAPMAGNETGASETPRTVAETAIPVAVGVEDYLLAHQRFSPASSMQGVAPYVRTVSAARKGDAR